MSPDWLLEMLSTITLEGIGPGMTRITITWRPYHSDEAGVRAFDAGRPGMTGGFSGTFETLEAYLAGPQFSSDHDFVNGIVVTAETSDT